MSGAGHRLGLLTALLALLLLALPAAAQTGTGQTGAIAPRPAPNLATPRAAPVATVPALAQVSPGHAAALGAGLFVGALAGSALIHGGAFAAAIGGVAGLALSHWGWTSLQAPPD
jgi:hypothetical protein